MSAPANINVLTATTVLEYELLTTHVDDLNEMSYTTYGIRVRDESGIIVYENKDVSTSKKFVQEFLNMVEGRDIAAIHIRDILEDCLA